MLTKTDRRFLVGTPSKSEAIKVIFNRKQPGSDPVRLPQMWQIDVGDINTFTTLWSVRLTKRRLALLAVAAVVAIALFGVVLTVATPLRALLPGYLVADDRAAFERMTVRVDSLTAVVDFQNDYLANIGAIFNNEITDSVITVAQADSVGLIPVDSILPASQAERQFMKEYEQREKHNLSVLSPIAAGGMSFFCPVSSGVVKDEVPSGASVRTLFVSAPSSAPVSSIYRGTVVAVSYEPAAGTTVVVQHPQNFVSVYTGLDAVYVARGEKVNAGTRIGALPSSRPVLSFEIWYNGSSLNALEYVSF